MCRRRNSRAYQGRVVGARVPIWDLWVSDESIAAVGCLVVVRTDATATRMAILNETASESGCDVCGGRAGNESDCSVANEHQRRNGEAELENESESAMAASHGRHVELAFWSETDSCSCATTRHRCSTRDVENVIDSNAVAYEFGADSELMTDEQCVVYNTVHDTYVSEWSRNAQIKHRAISACVYVIRKCYDGPSHAHSKGTCTEDRMHAKD
jgi:hypothetical protein